MDEAQTNVVVLTGVHGRRSCDPHRLGCRHELGRVPLIRHPSLPGPPPPCPPGSRPWPFRYLETLDSPFVVSLSNRRWTALRQAQG